MKKILVSIVAVALASGVAFAADMQQEDASIGLNCLQLIELAGIDMSETITPGPEDYARDLRKERVVNFPDGNQAGNPSVMTDANDGIGKGFAERTAALEMTIFTNAQDGAALFVHGSQPAAQQNILRLEDTYVSVCTEKTYILQNDLEGAYANATTMAVSESAETSTPSNTVPVEDNPRESMGGSIVDGLDFQLSTNAKDKAASSWLRIHNQAQHLFEVKMSTKAPRLIVINLGIANLARYTEGEYTNTLTFTLMPIVG
ncbi:hypothetical protein AUJ95_01215 [Candidatus Desantisbacteria bacterium CG2_30_40_21]|uniref:Uncharacterized protein n=5 Tax=unclassified Candidatus Desantisiibacteriota TaxID=3106372 RepID=A0A2M7JDG9_9BACT|nr:MAG: hypothetical protein AUJ95_01215 [Candidatus Desantisbacteria bacterium CG2_30_40_21]PIP40237.1 MAG: hypothetical protein COX18_07425 [Candidatus Desantisbacteria bacterium CG23_combo_of_CG06-09_8_20_14_all_40_23]PIX17454.1 MAG: hypothetical protein COZ71_03205 [Candidatus Desantisbacteria bacterium CG_4_8_14_3_um_filter_40_12]PIY18879.1 MAG: hypothetical protein COZ13_08250 [Candidatus Desantisbacteria bacterium CG_4_10_14_3_um_filter_40_18]PJB29971.1 MAG: hypothetical protein CO110_03